METAKIHDLSIKKMPTGISSLDPMMEGGSLRVPWYPSFGNRRREL